MAPAAARMCDLDSRDALAATSELVSLTRSRITLGNTERIVAVTTCSRAPEFGR